MKVYTLDELETLTSPKTYPLKRTVPVSCRANGPGRVTATINTGEVDRYATVIVPEGGRWDGFMRSGPAVLWEHGKDHRGKLPIGHCDRITLTNKTLVAEVRFKEDEFSRSLCEQYRDGTLRAFSVEFLPDAGKFGAPTRSEVRENPEWGRAHTIYRSWELTGFSAVAYPGNPFAIATDVRSRPHQTTGKGHDEEWAVATWLAQSFLNQNPEFVAQHVQTLKRAHDQTLRDRQQRIDRQMQLHEQYPDQYADPYQVHRSYRGEE